MGLLRRLHKLTKSHLYTKIDQVLTKLENRHQQRAYYYNYDFYTQQKTTQAERKKSVDPKLAQYYANLEVPYGSDLETVKNAWKKLLKKYHPDRHSTDPEKKQASTILTQNLNEAYWEIQKALSQGKL
jgi:DnaJ-domain-containing protein 1